METEDLREHERVASVGIEQVEQLVQLDPVAGIGHAGGRVPVGGGLAGGAVPPATVALRPADVVGTHAAGDPEQPAAPRSFGPEPVDRTDRTLVGLLREVVGVAPVAEVGTEPPHVGLGLADEAFERIAITSRCVDDQPGHVVHGLQSGPSGNRSDAESDLLPVTTDTCDHYVELLSARLDGETTARVEAELEDHLEHCDDCRVAAARMEQTDRFVRVRPAQQVPDLREVVLATSRPARLGRGGWLRPSLVWVGLVALVQSVIVLVLGELDGADTHQARHIGAFGVALGVGFLYVAWRPHRAVGLLPFSAALMVTMTVSAVFDVIDGGRTVLQESVHVSELIGLVLVWMIAGSPGLDRLPRRRSLRPAASTATSPSDPPIAVLVIIRVRRPRN